MPHLPGVTPVWTVYTYDSLGRLLTRKKPDGQSTTTYSYAGSTVTVTDSTGKWKKITRDSFGKIVKVEEPSPNPASEPNHITLYTYDVFGHLTKVQMDRTIGGTVRTQLRTWTYDSQTLRLLSKTSPEAGTASYTYNTDNTLATVTDAKNQRKVFTYDTYGRITQIARGAVSESVFTEDTSQRTPYTYEGTNSGYSSATNGRVSQVTYQGPHGLSFVEMYSYVNAGGISKKRVRIIGTPFGSSTINMDAGYTYDGEGRVLSTTYPGSQYNSNGTVSGGANYNYSYDTLGRLQTMSDSVSNTTWVSGVTYGPADEMLSMTANGFTETRTYSANLQLTDLISGANVHLKYNYSASQNNGQILSQDDLVSGETIGYQYDSLKRLTQANAIGDPSGSWQQNFGYDGFGNLTNKTSTNAPQLSVAVDWATNRIQSFASYDNNGNMTGYAGDVYSYDLQNRMIQAGVSGGGTVRYGYDTTNHRVYKGGYNTGTTTYSAEEFYFYGAEGHKYGTWQINPSTGVLLQASVTKQWFGGRLVSPEDRLGSKGRYFAFGEERTNISPTNPADDQEKFATYTRDAATGLDYANQRYFNSIVGRFTRPDPFGGSASLRNPQSWNRYSYVENDPATLIDRFGTLPIDPSVCGADPTQSVQCKLTNEDGGGYNIFDLGLDIGGFPVTYSYENSASGGGAIPVEDPGYFDSNGNLTYSAGGICNCVPEIPTPTPDYASYTLGATALLGASITVYTTQNGETYYAPAIVVGTPGLTASATVGSIGLQSNSTSAVNSFLTGSSLTASAFNGFGGAAVYSSSVAPGTSNFAFEAGVGTPAAGISYSYGFTPTQFLDLFAYSGQVQTSMASQGLLF